MSTRKYKRACGEQMNRGKSEPEAAHQRVFHHLQEQLLNFVVGMATPHNRFDEQVEAVSRRC